MGMSAQGERHEMPQGEMPQDEMPHGEAPQGEMPRGEVPEDRRGDPPSWSQQRAAVLAAQEQALEHARRTEHEKATAILREYVERFETAGIAPRPLRALPYKGSGTIRTPLHGWYLKHDRTIGIDTEARYFILRADGGLLTRLRGAEIEPVDAPLVVGRGGRDGETFDLRELLEMRVKDPVVA